VQESSLRLGVGKKPKKDKAFEIVEEKHRKFVHWSIEEASQVCVVGG
jgi:hypothetical protein